MAHYWPTFIAVIVIVAVMLVALAALEVEAFNNRMRRRVGWKFSPTLALLSTFFRSSNEPEESMLCQNRCAAPLEETMDAVKTLITFHRPCLQYPLSDYWWELNTCDIASRRISAFLNYPGENSKLSGAKISVEIVWVFFRSKTGVEVRLDWYRGSWTKSPHKHNILLSMVAYTEERIQRLNHTIESMQSNQAHLAAITTAHSEAGDMHARTHLLSDNRPSISWPSPQDYHEAVQNPSSCFTDRDLVDGQVEQNSLGMPRVMSGNFASVYRIFSDNGDWAVRCFLSPLKDQEQRYSILSKHLAVQTASSMVEFSFIEDGIKIGDKNYPVLKMAWIDGLPLHIYVENNLREPEKLLSLRDSFREMVRALRDAKIAHGDLQHGNILVRDDKPILVDYDGMFVPELLRFPSPELGHPNYQHPKRDGKHFGLFLDNFAGWLIDVSLVCLAEDPFLWDRYSGGDECLLFRRSDMLNPVDSAIFQHLLVHSSPTIKEATEHFLALLELELEDIPFLDLQGVIDVDVI